MKNNKLLSDLKTKTDSKILLFVMDGLGGLPGQKGFTELETANTPNMDKLASKGSSGLIDTVGRGITPGSGPGHLGIFGYNPQTFIIGRGALEAVGIGFDFQKKDVAMRFNFCNVDSKGYVTDRRAGRISTELNERLVEKIRSAKVPGIEIFVETVKEHRGITVFRKDGLRGNLHDTDPQKTGALPLKPETTDNGESSEMADIANVWLSQVFDILKDEPKANAILTRGWCNYPEIPTYQELYGLNPACIALYPMYRGVSKFAGMKVYTEGIKDFPSKIDVLSKVWDDHDFFFFHYKHTDSAGEDGDFDRKVACIEEVDRALPRILSLNPDVIAITGDHSTPSICKAHSWHPVPLVMSGKYVRTDAVDKFGETAAASGGLGRFKGQYLINELLAAAEKIVKYGA